MNTAHALRGVALGFALVLFVTAPVWALTTPIGTPNAYPAGPAPTHANVTLRAQTATGVGYRVAQVGLSAATIARLGYRAIGGPVGVAVIGALVLHDIYYDEIQGWLQPGGDPTLDWVNYWYMSSTTSGDVFAQQRAAGNSFPSGAAALAAAKGVNEAHYAAINRCVNWEYGVTETGPDVLGYQTPPGGSLLPYYRLSEGGSVWRTSCNVFDGGTTAQARNWYTEEFVDAAPVAAPDPAVATRIAEQPGLVPNILADAINRRTYENGGWPELEAVVQETTDAVAAVQAGTATPAQQEIYDQLHPERPYETAPPALDPVEVNVTVEVNVEAADRTCDPALGDQCEAFELPDPYDFDWMDPIVESIEALPGALPAGLDEPSGFTAIPDMISGGSGCVPFANDLFTLDLCPYWPTANTILSWIVSVLTFFGITFIWIDTMMRPQ